MKRSVTRAKPGLPPHQSGFASSTARSPGVQEPKRYGPVPIAALPLLKSSLPTDGPSFAGRMKMSPICSISVGVGCGVRMCSVSGSTTVTAATLVTACVQGAGLCRMWRTRSSE